MTVVVVPRAESWHGRGGGAIGSARDKTPVSVCWARRRFATWRLQLQEGFNLLLYGFGSKHALLDEFLAFASAAEPAAAVLVVNGAQPACSVRHVADAITKRVLGSSLRFGSLIDQCRYIALQLGGPRDGASSSSRHLVPPRVIVAIHNLDGPSLRAPDSQTAIRSGAVLPFLCVDRQ